MIAPALAALIAPRPKHPVTILDPEHCNDGDHVFLADPGAKPGSRVWARCLFCSRSQVVMVVAVQQ